MDLSINLDPHNFFCTILMVPQKLDRLIVPIHPEKWTSPLVNREEFEWYSLRDATDLEKK